MANDAADLATEISAIGSALSELQMEVQILKAGIIDERWQQASANFKQLSENVVALHERVSVLENGP